MSQLLKKFLYKTSNTDNSYNDDIWEDIPEKRSITYIILDLLLSPSYRLPRTVTTVRVYCSGNIFSVCPRCKNAMEYEYQSYCNSCGQYLDWSKLDDAEEEYVGWDGIKEDDY